MVISRNRYKLAALFCGASVPSVGELSGVYRVEMLTGALSLRHLNHRKYIWRRGGMNVGCNVVLRDSRWGHFYLDHAVCPWDGQPSLLINYNVPTNGRITRRMRDHVRCLEPDRTYLGRFSCIMLGKPRFLGYFSLSRVGE